MNRTRVLYLLTISAGSMARLARLTKLVRLSHVTVDLYANVNSLLSSPILSPRSRRKFFSSNITMSGALN